MKIKKARLREIVHGIVSEAAKDGQLQKIYRQSYAGTIKRVSKGGKKNPPPFTKKSSKPGKSGPPAISEQNDILAEGFEESLAEGKIGDWVSKNLNKLKPAISTFRKKLATGVEPFSIAIKKWKAGEKLSDDERANFIKALANAGIMLLPGGSMLLIIKHLVTNQIGSIA